MKHPSSELSLDACLERHRRIGSRAPLIAVETVGSTNRLARRIARVYLDGGRRPAPLVVIARGQSAGRGRRGRRWLSPAGTGIYTSLLVSVAGAAELSSLPLRVPLALCRALAGVGVECGIKWPNDLLVDGDKLGGVLIEAISGGRAVIAGYGINGSQTGPGQPIDGATSLRRVTGRAPQLSALAVDLAESVLGRLQASEPLAHLVEAYRERSVHRPGDRLRCRAGDDVVEGSFAGFDDIGRLRLATGDGERTIGSADLLTFDGVARESGFGNTLGVG